MFYYYFIYLYLYILYITQNFSKFFKCFFVAHMAHHDALQFRHLMLHFFFLHIPSPTTCIPDYTHTCIHNISSSPYLSSVRLPSDVAALRTQRRFVSSFQIMKIFIYKHINMNMNAVLCCAMLRACVCVSPSHPRTLAQKCTQLH